ncbi:hypothetical protein ACJX0J_009501, partial [Zea mays]
FFLTIPQPHTMVQHSKHVTWSLEKKDSSKHVTWSLEKRDSSKQRSCLLELNGRSKKDQTITAHTASDLTCCMKENMLFTSGKAFFLHVALKEVKMGLASEFYNIALQVTYLQHGSIYVFNVVEEEKNIENDGGTCCKELKLNSVYQLPTFDEVQSGQATLKTYSLYAFFRTLLLGDGEDLLLHDINLGKYFIISLFHIHLTDVVDYLQHMLDEFCSKEGAFFMFQNMFRPLVVEQKNLLMLLVATEYVSVYLQSWFFVTGIYIILQNSIIL